MKFSCKTKELLKTISIVGRAISSQQTLPILNNILIHAEGKRCTFSATNLEFSIISHIESSVENEGSITVPAKALQNFSQYSTDEEVVFESSEDSKLTCFSKKSKTIIAGEATSEYPTISPIQKETQFSVESSDLLSTIHYVAFAAAKTTTRPVLSGVYLKVIKDELVVVATDSYRLSEVKVPVKSQGEIECIIPSKVFSEMAAVLSGQKKGDRDEKEEKKEKPTNEPVTISLSSQQIEIAVGRTTILSRLIDGSFPNYQQIIPEKQSTKVDLPLTELTTTVKRMHYFAKESNNNLTLTVSPKELLIQTQATQAGRDEARMMVDVQGEKNKIALSSSYLLDFLSHVSGEYVQMELTDKMHPAVFHLPGQENFLHLIMPLRMSEE